LLDSLRIPQRGEPTAGRIVVPIFFMILLAVGCGIYRDYGLSWDEEIQRLSLGKVVYDYVTGANTHALLEGPTKYYGPAFEFLLVALEKLRGETDTREIYFMRHLVTFLVFYISLVFFYMIGKLRFGSWKPALLGCLFLVLSPRIFADAFYNSKDLPFLSVFIIALYTLLRFHERPSPGRATAHALVCAVLIDIRIVGVIVPMISVGLLILDVALARSGKLPTIPRPAGALLFLGLLAGFTVALWPTLWEGPWHHFSQAFKEMSRYPWDGRVLYLGASIKGNELPWHYIPVWMAITTPVVYSLLFVAGLTDLGQALVRDPLRCYRERKADLVFALAFFTPLAAVIFFHSVVYDAWRHLFFIYPPALLIALSGAVALQKMLRAWGGGSAGRLVRLGAGGAIALALGGTLVGMVRSHPHQNVYFNVLAHSASPDLKDQFEMDYWGLSYRAALEYILDHDAAEVITLGVLNYPGYLNAKILKPEQRERLRFTSRLADADYFVSNYRGHNQEYPFRSEFFSISVDGLKIMVVYRLKDGAQGARNDGFAPRVRMAVS